MAAANSGSVGRGKVMNHSVPAANTGAPALTPPPETGDVMAPNGCRIYWTTNDLGCRVYSSDEVGGGVHVWDTTIVDQSTLLACIVKEMEFQKLERVIAEKDLADIIKNKPTQFEMFVDDIKEFI